ncbi:class I SAM-dependent methyltransferase [Streptomyces sp. NPDC101151]|uniref:class I SAM-dependent methyltransferase n=1 Tax=Streptomyces sp. NPDC101151 TaxID=3366115 RepID=UPI003819756A
MPDIPDALFDDTRLAPYGFPGISPLSVLRPDRGPWQERRRTWDDLGLRSRRGREHVQTFRLGAINDSLSTFDPVLAETSYAWFCPPGGRVLDPFAGGSVRGLVAGNGGYQYTGIDLSPTQLDANEEQAQEWNGRDLLATTPTWMLGDAADVLPALPEAAYDYVFTCPPYHDLERYSDHPADLSAMPWQEFTAAYTEIIRESARCLAPDRFATWVVGEVRGSDGMLRGLVPLTVAAHASAGARLYNDAILHNPIGTAAMRLPQQWRASRKIGRHHQYVLTFVKGDPRAATRHIAQSG